MEDANRMYIDESLSAAALLDRADREPQVYWLVGPYLLLTLAFGGMIVPKIEL